MMFIYSFIRLRLSIPKYTEVYDILKKQNYFIKIILPLF